MPNWSDENGRFWWEPPEQPWRSIEIPHPPVSAPQRGCRCVACRHERKLKREKQAKRQGEKGAVEILGDLLDCEPIEPDIDLIARALLERYR